MYRTALGAVLALSLAAPAETFKPAPREIEDFLREILVDIVERGIPDYEMPRKGPVLLLRDMTGDGLLLSERALPVGGRISFKLIRWSAADGQAYLTRQRVSYVSVGGIRIVGDEASLSVGGELKYRRVDGHWVFAEVGTMLCS